MAPAKSTDGTMPSPDPESTEGRSTNTPITTPSVKDMLVAELHQLALVGMSLKKTLSEAKTSYKKKVYEKKLKKNSQYAAQVIVALERLQIAESIKKNREEQEFIDKRDNTNDNEV